MFRTFLFSFFDTDTIDYFCINYRLSYIFVIKPTFEINFQKNIKVA